MMAYLPSRRALAVLCGWMLALLALTACAPQLVGLPEHTGLVVLEAEIEREGILGLGSTNYVQTAVLDGLPQAHTGQSFGKYVVFSNLEPGEYTFRSMSYSSSDGVRTYTTTYTVSAAHLAQVPQLKLQVAPGHPAYVGKFKVFAKKTFTESELKVSYESDPALEKQAWTKMLAEYKASPWAQPIQQRLDELK